MGYFDGGTTTALWNYAQHFAMSDNSYGTTFGPSTVGALNLVSGQTHGASGPSTEVTAGTVTGDPQPTIVEERTLAALRTAIGPLHRRILLLVG